MLTLTNFAKRKVYDYPTQGSKGVDLNKLKQDIDNVRKGNANIKNLSPSDLSKLKHQQELNRITVRGIKVANKVGNKVDKLQVPITKRLEQYKFNKEKQKEFDEVNNLVDKYKNKTNTTVKPINNELPKVELNNTKSSNKTKLNKLKLGNKAKLGIAGIGLVTAGLVANRIRKARSDRGKARGKYNK